MKTHLTEYARMSSSAAALLTVPELVARERAAADKYEATGASTDLVALKRCTRAVEERLESDEAAEAKRLVLEQCDQRMNDVLDDDDARSALCIASDRVDRAKRRKVGDARLAFRFDALLQQEDAMAPEDLEREAAQNSLELEGGELVLAEHQQEGVTFLLRRAAQKRGAMLAFTMGLGKTLTTLSFLAHFAREDPTGQPPRRSELRAVVVCPLSVVDNWNKEFARYVASDLTPKLPSGGCVVVEDRATMCKGLPHWAEAGGVAVVSYDTLKAADRWTECGPLVAALYETAEVVVLDEMHELKNSGTKKAQAVDRFKTPVRVGLTGTPLANSPGELYHVAEILEPGLLRLDAKEYKKAFTDPIMLSMHGDATEDERRKGKEQRAVLRQMTSHLMLHRTWTTLEKSLPDKREFMLVYDYGDAERAAMAEKDESVGYLQKQANVDAVLRLTKAQIAVDLVRQFGDESVLVFSEHPATLKVIHDAHGDSRMIDGATKREDRAAILDAFAAGDFQVLLLTYGTSAVGINCQAASRVLLLDPHENPTKEAQAVCRAWRMGQTKPVTAYRFAAVDTVEMKIIRRGILKTNMTRTCIEGGSSVNQITHEDVRSCALTDSVKLLPLREAPDAALRAVEPYVSVRGWGDYDSFFAEHDDDRVNAFNATNDFNVERNKQPRFVVVDGTPTPVPEAAPGVRVDGQWRFARSFVPIVRVNADKTLLKLGPAPAADDWHYEISTRCTYEGGETVEWCKPMKRHKKSVLWQKKMGVPDYTLQVKSRYTDGKAHGPWSAASAEFLVRD